MGGCALEMLCFFAGRAPWLSSVTGNQIKAAYDLRTVRTLVQTNFFTFPVPGGSA
jgi:hypothetical protein